MRGYLAVIAWYHKMNNFQDPTLALPIQRMLVGAKHVQPARTQLSPITRDILHKMVDNAKIVFSEYEATLTIALLLFMYHCCLRASEAMISNNAEHTVYIENMNLIKSETGTKLSVKLTSYKHSDAGSEFILCSHADVTYCPVTAMLNFLKLRGTENGLFFIHQNKKPVRREYLAKQIKFLISSMKLDPNNYNTHSLRAGRATDLAVAGTPEAIIKQTGRWKSPAFLKYVRFDCFMLPE